MKHLLLRGKKLKKRQVIWKHNNNNAQLNNTNQLAFNGKTALDPAVMSLETPYSFFQYFFDGEMFSSIAEQVTCMLCNAILIIQQDFPLLALEILSAFAFICCKFICQM